MRYSDYRNFIELFISYKLRIFDNSNRQLNTEATTIRLNLASIRFDLCMIHNLSFEILEKEFLFMNHRLRDFDETGRK